jgi:hypothetical protein
MKTPPDPPPSIERHSRKCAICTHPDREAIEEAFLHRSRCRVWAVNRLRDCNPTDSAQQNRVRADDSARQNIVQIVKDYDVPSLSSLYRHAHATGPWIRRRTKIRFALDRIIENAGEAKSNAFAIIRVIQISCRFDKDGTYVEPTKRVLIEHSTVTAQSTSNRNPLRLETTVTPTKQTPQLDSKSNSNREALRLETPVTPTKQTPEPHSNRENNTWFSATAGQVLNAEIQRMLIGK